MNLKFRKFILSFIIVGLFVVSASIFTTGNYNNPDENNEDKVDSSLSENELENKEDNNYEETESNKEDVDEGNVNNDNKPNNKPNNNNSTNNNEVNNDNMNDDGYSNNNDDESIDNNNDNQSTKLISLGTFRLTAYCGCSKCCGQWAGSPTASGVMPRANHTIAVDTSVIPFGTQIVIYGNTYVAEDTGSGVNGNCIDIYFDSHQAALNFGVQYTEVFMVVS